jgi:hypothetical protein
MRIILRICLISVMLAHSACREPEAGFVFLENATTDTLQLTVEFESKDPTSKPLLFSLKPGESDGWRFTGSKSRSDEADSKFQALLIKSENCEQRLERPMLKKHVRKNGAWILRIDEALFSC